MSFKFTLQKILDLTLRKEDDIKNKIAVLLKKQMNLHREIEKNQQALAQMQQAYARKAQEGISIEQFRLHQSYLRYIEQQINHLQLESQKLQGEIESRRQEYLEIQQKRKGYEKLKEKQYQQFLFKEAKEEEKLIDQIVTFQRSKKEPEA